MVGVTVRTPSKVDFSQFLASTTNYSLLSLPTSLNPTISTMIALNESTLLIYKVASPLGAL